MILFVDFHSVSIVRRIVLLLSNHNVRAVRSNSAGRGLAVPTVSHVSAVSCRVLQGRSSWRDPCAGGRECSGNADSGGREIMILLVLLLSWWSC